MNYLNNLILDFGANEVNAITSRLVAKQESYSYIRVTPKGFEQEPTAEELKLFEKVNSQTRIYLLAHGETEYSKEVYGYEDPKIPLEKAFYSSEKISSFLASRLPQGNLKLSLIICYAAVNERHFATHLHQDLAKYQIVSDILARKNLTVVINNAGENTGKKIVRTGEERNVDVRTNYLNDYFLNWLEVNLQKPGTKAKFTWDSNGEAIVLDAYIAKFCEHVLSIRDEIKILINDNDVLHELDQLASMCTEVTSIGVNEMNFISKKLLEMKSLEIFTKPSLLKHIGKIEKISAKYNDVQSSSSNFNNFVKFALLACHQLIENLRFQKGKIQDYELHLSALNKLEESCKKLNVLNLPEIKRIVKEIKNINSAINNFISTDTLKTYEYARKLMYQWTLIEPNKLGYFLNERVRAPSLSNSCGI